MVFTRSSKFFFMPVVPNNKDSTSSKKKTNSKLIRLYEEAIEFIRRSSLNSKAKKKGKVNFIDNLQIRRIQKNEFPLCLWFNYHKIREDENGEPLPLLDAKYSFSLSNNFRDFFTSLKEYTSNREKTRRSQSGHCWSVEGRKNWFLQRGYIEEEQISTSTSFFHPPNTIVTSFVNNPNETTSFLSKIVSFGYSIRRGVFGF